MMRHEAAARGMEFWGISTGEGLIGVYRFDHTREPPTWCAARIALFKTRREARAHLGTVKGPSDRGLYPRAKIVKLRVSITLVGSQ